MCSNRSAPKNDRLPDDDDPPSFSTMIQGCEKKGHRVDYWISFLEGHTGGTRFERVRVKRKKRRNESESSIFVDELSRLVLERVLDLARLGQFEHAFDLVLRQDVRSDQLFTKRRRVDRVFRTLASFAVPD